jgi:phosphohistidine phosphatase
MADDAAGTSSRKELLLMRHAKSDWDSGIPRDFDRCLSPRGLRDARRMGRWIADASAVPDHVVCSPAKRVRETVELVLSELGLDPSVVQWEERIYEAAPSDLLHVLGKLPAAATRVLMVGHNPGMEMLVAHLARDPLRLTENGKLFPTATLARLECEAEWNLLPVSGCKVLDLVRPKELSKT